MINMAQIQVQAMMRELKAQRDALGDRALNLAVELAVANTDKTLLEARVKNLEEQIQTLRESSEAVPDGDGM